MIDVLIILLTLVGLVVGGHYFVLGASAVGHRCGMSPVLVGATIVAIGTSLPEWAVSVHAALQGYAGISVGNVVGSNVCNMGIVLGLAALVMPLQTDRMITLRDGVIMLLATLLLIGVTLDSQISRVDGVVLLVAGAAAIAIFLRTGRADQDVEAPFHWWEIPRAVAALVLVLVSSHFFIGSAEHLSLRFGISPWLIGITIAAIGTSLPELVTSMAAAVQGQSGIILGNVLGSSTMNIVWVLGSAGVIRPMESPQFTPVAAVLLAALMVLAFVFIATGRIVARWEGAVLLIAGLGWYFAQGL